MLIYPLGKLLLLGITAGAATAGFAAPYTPAGDSVVLEQLPFRARSATGQELTALRREHLQAPGNAQAASRLANRYFELALERGDPRYVGQADAVVQKVAPPLGAELLLIRGKLRQYRHGFAGALQDFSEALKLDPDLAEAHSWRAAILMVQANYDAAQPECEALLRLDRTSLAQGCMGLVLAYTGDLGGAQKSLEQALAGTTSPGNRLWVLTRLGEVAAWQGETASAEKYYRAALALGRDDSYLLAAWADFLLDQSRPAEVVSALKNWEAVDGLLLRLALAQARLQGTAASERLQMLGERFAAAQSRGDSTHQAEESRFQLTLKQDADTALRLAVDNFRIQREPRDARVVLEAAIAKGDPVAAEPVYQWLAASGFRDTHITSLARKLRPSATAGVRP